MKYCFIIILLFVQVVSVSGEDWKEVVKLRGFWKFNIGDNFEWRTSSFNDDDWDEIKVPSPWEDEGYHGYNGYAWYRKHFYVPEEIMRVTTYLSLGFIDDVDEVYLNGKLVGFSGTFPPEYKTAYNAFRRYPVPSNYFNPGGENVIAIRVYDSQLGGGIVNGDISVMALRSVKLEYNLEGNWKFHTGDENEWKSVNYDDRNWKEIPVPSYWELHGYENYNGFAWYRKKFTIDKKFKGEKFVAVLGKIDDIDECYLNGVLIGSIGDFIRTPKTNNFNREWSQLRGYYIPENLLKFGEENVIAVRVYDGYINGGIYQGPVGIALQSEYNQYWKDQKKKRNFWDIFFGE